MTIINELFDFDKVPNYYFKTLQEKRIKINAKLESILRNIGLNPDDDKDTEEIKKRVTVDISKDLKNETYKINGKPVLINNWDDPGIQEISYNVEDLVTAKLSDYDMKLSIKGSSASPNFMFVEVNNASYYVGEDKIVKFRDDLNKVINANNKRKQHGIPITGFCLGMFNPGSIFNYRPDFNAFSGGIL